MKKLIIALFLAPLCGVFLCAPALAQQTKAQLSTQIGTTFPDNTSGQITPAGVRSYESNVINSIMPTAPVVAGNLACFNGTTGLLQDCGSAPTTVPLTVGVTPISSGTSGNVVYDNSGKFGEIGISALFDMALGSTRGAIAERGAAGWAAVGPGSTSGLPWVSNGTGADPAYQLLTGAGVATNTIANTNLAQGNANTIKGNPTSSTANEQDFTIGGLTQKASPTGTDLLLIQDQAASGALKYATVGSVASAGSVSSLNTQTGVITLLTEPQGRLTLTANTPVMSASATAQTTLRYDCSIGGQVPYYTGSADALDTIASCEVTDAMVSAASAGQVVSGQVYDVWWVHSGANRICLAMSAAVGGGGGWASDTGGSNTSRGTGYTQLDAVTRPYRTNKNSISNCFNAATNYGPVSANQGTYLGTVYASGNGQISWTLGAASSGGTAALLGVWNAYNRVTVTTTVTDSGTIYAYSTASVRQARASAGNQIQFVLGAQEDGVQFSYTSRCVTAASTSSVCQFGVGFDAINAFSIAASSTQTSAAVAITGANTNSGVWSSGVGLHTLSANELSDGTSTQFDGGANNALMASLRM